MLKVNQEEKERILKLHESKNSKNLLSEQGSADRFVDNQARQYLQNANQSIDYNTANVWGAKPGNKVWYEIYSKFCNSIYDAWGTREKELIASIERLGNLGAFQKLERLIKQSKENYWDKGRLYNNFESVIRGELDAGNTGELKKITDHLQKIGVSFYYEPPGPGDRSGKYLPYRFKIGKDPNAKASTSTSNSTQPQTPAQPQRQLSTVNRSAQTDVQNKTKEIQRALGMKETGKMDQATINKAYEIISQK